jgi:hypothetical protein
VKPHKRVLATSLVVVAGLLSASPAAFGSTGDNPNASCVGAGSSALSPGSGIEGFAFPGARADVSHFVVDSAKLAGTPPGQLIKPSAQDKGTALVCFPEGPPGS